MRVELSCEGMMLAVGSLMVMPMLTESEPPELLAQTVYVVALILTLGVPEITPYASMVSPAGRAGDISQEAAAPPLFGNDIEVAAEPLVATRLLCEAVILGTVSFTEIVKVAESEPPELFAHTVNKVLLKLTLGVPEMTPFALRLRPLGKAGEISHEAIAPPLFVMLTGFIVVPRVR